MDFDDKATYLLCPTEYEVTNLWDAEPTNCKFCKVLVFAKTKNLAANPVVICEKCWNRRKPKEHAVIGDTEWHNYLKAASTDHLKAQMFAPDIPTLKNKDIDEGYISCSKVSYGPHISSLECREEKCTKCGEGAWLSKAMYELVDSGKVKVLCNECSLKMLADNPEMAQSVGITEAQRKELRKKGITDKQIDNVLRKIADGQISLKNIIDLKTRRRS